MPLALRARALWKSYAAGVAGCSARIWVLRGASIEVEQGECVAVLGARGAGTTTLLHCLAGMRRPDAGIIEHAVAPALLGALPSEWNSNAHSPRAGRLLLCDDELHAASDRTTSWSAFTRSRPRDAIIIATHELAPVRRIADRVLILRDGRLIPIDRALGARRVAEGFAASSA